MHPSDSDAVARYLNLTAAAHALGELTRHARALDDIANTSGTIDGPLEYALLHYRDAAGAAATAAAPPVEALTSDHHYAEALTAALDTAIEAAGHVIEHARAVRSALDAGLITAPRDWTPTDITSGALTDHLNTHADADTLDRAQLWGAVAALTRHHASGAIDAACYERHMTLAWDLAPDTGDATPELEAALGDTLDAWHATESADARALAEPAGGIQARQAIHAANTYARLTQYAHDLAGAAWDSARSAASGHLVRLYRRANELGTDAYGKTAADAADLFAFLDSWRVSAYAANMAAAERAADLPEGPDRNAVYLSLYTATDLAVTTGQLCDIWHRSGILDRNQWENIRTGVLLRYEESSTGTGVALTDDGPHAQATRDLRDLIDAHPVSEQSNLAHTVRYRQHLAALGAIRTTGLPVVAESDAAQAWEAIMDSWDTGAITRRQALALADRMEAIAGTWASGLPGWDALTAGRAA